MSRATSSISLSISCALDVPPKLITSPQTHSSPPSPSPPYTVFSPRQKRFLSLLLGFACLASPLTATIYFPLIPLLSTKFHTSVQGINISITIYVVFQALSPALFATLSDSFGRRPILLATFALYVLANLGLALNKDVYSVLLILRALQSLGASAVLSIAYGVVADVCVPAERGKLLGPLMAATNLGPCIGPVVGGWVALGSSGYRWVFWCLVIYGATALMMVGWGFPETGRSVVGNGSVRATGWRRIWWSYIADWVRSKREIGASAGRSTQCNGRTSRALTTNTKKNERFKISSFIACIRIIFWRDTALVLWMTASFYSVWYCIQTSIPSIYQDIYGFNELEIGLTFLPGGVGVILGGFATGKLMDSNYRKTAKEIGFTVDKVFGDDMNRFPIERARSRGSWCLLAISSCVLVGYGWAVETHAHPSISLILQCIMGFMCTVFNQIFSALLVDVFPGNPSAAAASGNIARCTLSAAVVAILQPLVHALGRGWFFTLLGIVTGVAGFVAVLLIQTCGRKWRGQRTSKAIESSSGNDSGEVRLAQDTKSGGPIEKEFTTKSALDYSIESHERAGK